MRQEQHWKLYRALPIEVQRQADKQFALCRENPFHPCLHFGDHDEYERFLR